ncbi:MAG: cation:proton antiporter [Hyphomicrobium aestuarii]|nr:cation:proton antiporter [Hyphomicrobium aestuarii]
MAGSINIPAYSDALVVLATAGVVVPLVQRLGISPILGYLVAGAILGPLGLGSFISEMPALYWVTVVDAKNVAGIADLGVVFLLFLIGLEMSVERLTTMRRLVLGLGGFQVAVSTIVIAAILSRTGLSTPSAFLIGASLALSSTAIVLEVLSKANRMTSATGRASFAVLLAQDLAVIPLLIFVSILSTEGEQPIWLKVVMALGQAAVALGVIVLTGRTLMRPLFRLVAGTRSSELFIATTLFVIVATGVVAAVAGVSMALGAFVAGLLLAGTEYRKAIEATIEPFKGLLLGIFFFTVGMGIDVRELARQPLLLVGAIAGLILLKAAIVIALARLYRVPWAAAVETGLLLGPGGEFAFVAIGLATATAVIAQPVASFTLAVTSLTMMTIPLMPMLAHRLAPAPVADDPANGEELAALPDPRSGHAIVVGYGRVGQVVCDLLDGHGIPYTATDFDAATVTDERRRGKPVYFGNATDRQFLLACGLMGASGLVITIHSRAEIDAIVTAVRALRPDILIVSRARDAEHARHLYGVGVTDAVPETIEASLQLSEAVLVGLGVPTGPVIASIHEKRDVFRAELQTAARNAGQSGSRAIRKSVKPERR